MSDRIPGERVFCHECSNEWPRDHGGLQCPRCDSSFVEILETPSSSEERIDEFPGGDPFPPVPGLFSDQTRPRSQPPPIHHNTHPLANHNPWADAPDPEEDDITSFQFNTMGGGRGTFSFTSRTYRSNGRNNGIPPQMNPFGMMFGGTPQAGLGRIDGRGGVFPRDARGQPQPADMQDLFSMIFQTMQQGGIMNDRPVADLAGPGFGGGARGARQGNPFDLLSALLNPSGRHGDTVWSQEAFDRILEQLSEQNHVSTAPPPASEQAIKSLPTKQVTKEMMGNDGTAECSICMDNVEIGSDITELPCKHWFHKDCVTAWLKEHDTCPHCRKPITEPDEQQPQMPRRRSSRPSASNNPFGGDGSNDRAPNTTGGLREARNSYYQNGNNGNNRSAYAESREMPAQYDPGGRQYHDQPYPGVQPYSSQQDLPPRPRRHSSTQGGRPSDNNRQNDRTSNSGGGIGGWVRNHLGMG